jgi:uncharacterized membrane protein
LNYDPFQANSGPMNFDVIQENSELRAYARRQLKGVWGQMALAGFIYFLILVVPSCIFSDYSDYGFNNPFQNSFFDVIFNIAAYVITGPMTLGISGYFLKRTRSEEIGIENIFDGLNCFFPSFFLTIFSTLLVMLWSLLLIIPGFIKWLGYSMAIYILYDNPEMNFFEALKRSQVMMKGYKEKLFMLHLSFMGWALLCIFFTLGIGFIWLFPYIMLSKAGFYENLKRHQEKEEINANQRLT